MSVSWDLHYDRRVSAKFLAHFQQGGIAHSLVEYARHAPYPLDLQMRADPKAKTEHATLYVGLTAVLNVLHKPTGLALKAHPTFTQGNFGFQGSWGSASSVEAWQEEWPRVEDYLERVIPEATKKHASREGAVQAAASVFATKQRVMLDREAALHFRDTPTKKEIFSELTGPVVSALQGIQRVPGKVPTSFGGECDLLAVDQQGRLLAVEVKPRDTASIRWAAAQATVYASLFERWINWPPPKADPPGQILKGMIEQRVSLGLADAARPDIPDQPEVLPVVAVQRGAKETYIEGLKQVQRALLAAGVGHQELQICEVNMAGRLDPISL